MNHASEALSTDSAPPAAPQSDANAPHLPRLHPDAAVLLATVAAFLDEVAPQLEGADRYRSRIAVNVLRIVQRELAGRDAADRAEREELAALLSRVLPPDLTGDDRDARAAEPGADADTAAQPDQRLAQALRAGRAPLDDAELRQGLQRSLERALRINNPKWLPENC